MKKVFLAILATIAVVGMVSCNKDDNGKGKKDNGKKTTEVSIKIDGNLDDWKDVPVAAEISDDVAVGRDSLLTLKVGADSKNLYVYYEFIMPEGEPYVPVDIFVDSDNDITTGFSAWLWEIGWEFLVESETGCLENATTVRNMEDATIYKAAKWQNDAGEQIGGWDKGAEQEPLTLTGFLESAGKVANGIGFVEISIERGAINARAKGSLGLGIEVHVGSWADNGILPEYRADYVKNATVTVALP